jgi:V/A-type H+-transporting ATPase subunit E
MSVQLQELIDRIKREGVKEAQEEAARITEEARKRAAEIIDEAGAQAKVVIEKAETEASRTEETSRAMIRQAARDLLLKVRTEITQLFERILRKELSEVLDRNALKQIIVSLLNRWSETGRVDVKVLVPEKELDALAKHVMAQLSSEIKQGVEIKPSPQLKAGFRVMEKDGSAFYDITDDGLAQFLMESLNPRVAEYLKES